ncbi:MAG: 4-hydroxy-3-methylbut-2-enyl diphosphate reductase [Dehalococcoidia bacterium]|jgi:4-hydroxy-3-methylbut-2-enyl diphosphate reductase|nr:4-hydroxy-3-methylbut-2-enyl diphosphate reductase [Dehalococcoidia bacterium]
MEIILARDMGFCWGVRRAISIMEEVVQQEGEVYSLGPIVHNPLVMAELEKRGVRAINGNIPIQEGKPLAITAHGAGPEIYRLAREKGIRLIDTTCPIVTRSQRWARRMAQQGFTIIIFGDAQHREVKGVLAWTEGKGMAVTDVSQVPRGLSRIAVISQTTQEPRKFAAFVAQLLQERIEEIHEFRLVGTLCNVTSSQQEAARELARQVDVVIVVGGRNSANTRHLAEVCQETGVPTYHIERAEELDPAWVRGCRKVGITAGASTPDWAVQEVVSRLRQLDQEGQL